MKQLTKLEVEAVVESIQNPNPRLYCPNCNNDTIKCTDCDCTLWKNDHTYIGTVLEKMQNRDEFYPSYRYEIQGELVELVLLWQPLGLSRSLQEIVSGSEWKEIWECGCEGSHLKNGACGIPLKHISQKHPSKKMEVLTSPEANALFSFLQEII